ncbi:MAG: PD-(D/E)XK nuclease family protein [Prevotella sp.]|nr:PD-(D/E)XK nuclease family protein [Bacteroides sp.]MCM1366107.1 PD-(D/E)XK nuclease family protein [Prevotella sp.]MCM1436592.1 PD-(D/E)XK nuclease family protein [Prevotella sp.]
MKHFLQVIAEQYASRYYNLSEFSFIFPNKRSGTFFEKYLKDTFGKTPRLSPEITTVSDFITTVGGVDVDNRIDLLFTLYNIYIKKLNLPKEQTPTFEKFSIWGEVALRDFSETDLYGVDAGQLFRNVKEYRKIASSFLTEEQVEVLQEYFDMEYFPPDPSKFWIKHYNDDPASRSQAKRKFRTLWESLGELYTQLTENLSKRSLATTGGAYRKAVEQVEELGYDSYPSKKLIFVGFNVLSKMEFLLFKMLSRITTQTEYGSEPFADFIWDVTGPLLKEGSAGAGYVSRNLKIFPKPAWLHLNECDSHTFPSEITLISAPSNTLQAKIAGEVASRWHKENTTDFEDARVALVLPDENLLLPLIYSLPDEVDKVNLTMGAPLRLTATMSFIDRIKRLQIHRTKLDGEPAFFHEDLILILSHPFTQALIGIKGVAEIRKYVTNYRKFALIPSKVKSLCRNHKNAGLLFNLIDENAAPDDVIQYLVRILTSLKNIISEDNLQSPFAICDIDRTHIDTYIDALHRLSDSIREHKISVRYTTLLSLADRLLSSETVSFEGKPLQGLQVMGLLETRSLDFDRIIIPSMNEKIMPRRIRRKSFIPESIRRGFGMPSSGYEESIFAYYFYRLLARAKNVTMIYDARTGEGKGGDVSRYVLQLRHLFPELNIKRINYNFDLKQGVTSPLIIKKDDTSIKILKQFTDPHSDKSLSATTIQNYNECPVKFFFRSIAGIPDTAPPKEFMDEITIGNVFHFVMERIYKCDDSEFKGQILPTPLIVDKEYIENWLNDENSITNLITEGVNIKFFNRKTPAEIHTPLRGEPLMTSTRILSWIKKVLHKDLAIAPFEILGTEFGQIEHFPIPSEDNPEKDRLVNIRYSIDRIDRISENGRKIIRIVDYKTGAAHLKAENFDNIFQAEYKSKNILQPLLYAHLLNFHIYGPQSFLKENPIRPELYAMVKNSSPYENFSTPNINITDHEDELRQTIIDESTANGLSSDDGDAKADEIIDRLNRKGVNGMGNVTTHTDVAPLFLPRLYKTVNDILDPEKDFKATDNRAACEFCPYAQLCHR